MKLSEKTPGQLKASDSSYIFLFGVIFCGAILSAPYWATADLAEEDFAVMRWVAFAALFLTLWASTSIHIVFDAHAERVTWRRRLPLLPFVPLFNRKIEAPLASDAEVKLIETHSDQKDLASLTLLLSDGQELRLTHAATSVKAAKALKSEIEAWLTKHL